MKILELKSDPLFITLCSVDNMADATNESSIQIDLKTVQELMKVQENSFKAFVHLMVDDFNKRFELLRGEVADIKSSLELSQSEIDQLKAKVPPDFDKNFKTIKDDLSAIEDKVDYLENQSRRNNIRISGLAEEVNEDWSSTEEKVKSLISEKLELDTNAMVFERAHRTGKRRPNKPRQIVAKLLSYKDRDRIIQASKKLKGTGIYVNEDLSSRVIQRRKQQQDKLIEARKDGKIAYFNMDRLIIKPRVMFRNVQPFGELGAQAGFAYYDKYDQQDET